MGGVAGYNHSVHLRCYFVCLLSRVFLQNRRRSAVLRLSRAMLCVCTPLWTAGWNWFGKTIILYCTESRWMLINSLPESLHNK